MIPITAMRLLLTLALTTSLLSADGTLHPPAVSPTSKTSDTTTPGKPYVYKTSAGVERKMEIYFPPDHTPTNTKVPGLILFHGGGWKGGTLAQFRHACSYFASRGLVCATAEYQMLSRTSIPQLPAEPSYKRVCVTDAKSAIRWFKQNAPTLGIDPSRLITGGGSAGAHISALATMNPGLNDPADPANIDTGVVAYLWFNPAFTAADQSDPEIDVLHHLNAKLPPTLVLFGEDDEWLPGWNAAQSKWKSLGSRSIDLRFAPAQKHGFFNIEPWKTTCLLAADEFLTKHGFLTGKPTLALSPDHQLQPAR